MSGAPEPAGRLPVVLVGAGMMGHAWLAELASSRVAQLVGVADLDLVAARSATAEVGLPDLPVGPDAVHLAARTGARAVIDVTVPAAHHPVTTEALFAGLPVLGEKPAAATVAQALSLAAASEATGLLFMVSQSRRWNPQLFALRSMAQRLGSVGSVTTQFSRAPHFGGYRDEMAYPLLLDMAIHPFDAARFVLGAEPVSAYCQSWNPSWSWYAGDAAASAVFEMSGGTRYGYHGTWCTPGAETSWNGSWRVSGEHGTALWDGDHEPVLDTEPEGDVERPEPVSAQHEGIAAALDAFVAAVAGGPTPMGEVHENVLSLAMVEAAVLSARSSARVLIDEVLEQAHAEALRTETRGEVRDALAGWASVRAALAV